jgi:hypothetical protein
MHRYGSEFAPQFLRDVYPDRFVPDILRLVVSAWESVTLSEIPAKERLEPRISSLLVDQIEELIWDEARIGRSLPFTINKETQICDPITGKQNWRWDIEFLFRDHRPPRRRAYLVFEAKRLRITDGRHLKANNDEYIQDMQAFVHDTKQVAPALCGMIGYAMYGRTAQARSSLYQSLARHSRLNLTSDPPMRGCPHLNCLPHGETEHWPATNRQGPLVICHVLLHVRP